MVRSRRKPQRQGPSLRIHNNGQFVVRVRGRDHYLGSVRDTPEDVAQQRRFEILAAAAKGELPTTATRTAPDEEPSLTLTKLVDTYMAAFCKRRPTYRNEKGEPAAHAKDVSDGLQVLKDKHGNIPAAAFRKSYLVRIRDRQVEENLARSTINRRLARVKELFRWAAERDLVPEDTWTALLPVKGVRAGEGKESRRVGPVSEETVATTIPHLPVWAATVVELLLRTGARASEILTMRRRDLDMGREDGVWILTVAGHKNEWRGKDRRIYLDKEAQEILLPFLPLNPDAYVFSPARCVEEHKRALRRERKSKLTPSQLERDRRNRENPRREFRPHFTSDVLRVAVSRGCREAGVEQWHTHQLRHTAAGRFEREHGLQVARALLGHSGASMTLHYSKADEAVILNAIGRASG